MSLPVDDFLSSYHDGELTAAERAIVERQLINSAEKRRELNEIGQVSALIKEMRGFALPAEFPQQVLQGIEREMLIPTERSRDRSNAADRMISLRAEPSPQRWLIGATAVLTSAAGLLLLVRTFGDRPTDLPPYAGEAGLSQSAVVTAPAPFRKNTEIADASRSGNTIAPEEVIAPTAESDVASLAGNGAAVAMKESNRLPVAAFSTPRRVDGVANLFLDQATLKTAAIGDVVEALQTLDDEIAVVRLTVVDRQEGLNQLQLLFANNQIDPQPAIVPQEKAKADVAKTAEPTQRDVAFDPEQLMAVYVESNSQHLTAALQELSQRKLIQSLEVEPPISLTELDTPNDKSFAKSEKLQARAFKPTAETINQLNSQRALVETLNQARQFPIMREDAALRSQDRKSSDQSSRLMKKGLAQSNAKDAPQAASRQMTLQVPANALPQQTSQNLQSRARTNIGQQSQSQSKQNIEVQNEQRPMQVLFVVVNQAGNGSKMSGPSAVKPSTPAKNKDKKAKSPEDGGAA